jgi:L-fucose mutarotase
VLTSGILHPAILSSLAAAGHGSLILIADANFPASTRRGPFAEVVHLNLAPGVVNAPTVLNALLSMVRIEESTVMRPAIDGPYAMAEEPPVWSAFRDALFTAGADSRLHQLDRYDFYSAASHSDLALTIVTAETEIYANILLRVGVERAGGSSPG